MTAPANRWKLGLFVLGGCGVVLTGFSWLGLHELKRATHEAWVYFDEALTGLEEGSPVKFRGVTIGRVDRIRVGPDKKHLAVQAALFDDYLVDLGLEPLALGGDRALPENLRAQVVMSWVTGTSFIQVDFLPDPPAGPQQLPFAVKANTLRTVPSTAKSLEDASREVLRDLPVALQSARELLDLARSDLQAVRLPELAARADRVLAQLEQQLGELREQGTVAKATAALDAARSTVDRWRAPDGPVEAVLRELQAFTADLRRMFGEASLPETMRSMRDASAGVAEAGRAVATVPGDLRAGFAQLRSTLAAVERLVDLLERDPSALLRGRAAGSPSPLEEQKR